MTRWSVALLICSDRAAQGARADASADLLRPALTAASFDLSRIVVVADERSAIEDRLRDLANEHAVVLTSGGTGVSPRDVTVEATLAVIDKEVPGIGEAMRQKSLLSTPMAMLSRATAGVRGGALIVNLPGSPRGSLECLEVVLPVLAHALRAIRGEVKDCKEDLQRA